MRIAPVQLDVVNVPLGKRLGVSFQVSQDTGVPRAGEIAVVFIDAKLEALRMYLNKDKAKKSFSSKTEIVRCTLMQWKVEISILSITLR